MGHKKLLKYGAALLLCMVLIMPVYGIRDVLALLDYIPIEDEGSHQWEEKLAIYWNPGIGEYPGLATKSNAEPMEINSAESESPVTGKANENSGLATGSNVSKNSDLARDSITEGITGLATDSNSNVILATGSNAANGLTPETAVKSLYTAIKKAEMLSRKSGAAISDVVIYAMNPMVITPETTCTVKGKGVTIVPWGGRDYNEEYIFIVDGGRLSLNHVNLRSDDGLAAPKESALVYVSSGDILLGEQVNTDGIFVLDYTRPELDWLGTSISQKDTAGMQTEANKVPVIELMEQFDFVGNYKLELHIPAEIEHDVTVVKASYFDKMPAEEFKNAFPVIDPMDEWELFVENRTGRERRNAIESNVSSQTSELTQKSLIARHAEKIISGRLWLDENENGVIDPSENGVAGYTVSLCRAADLSTVIQETATQEDGTYQFKGMETGGYVVGINSETIDETKYLLPLNGITHDNKFEVVKIDGEEKAYSQTVHTADVITAESNINAGLRQSRLLYTSGEFVNVSLGGNVLTSGDEGKLVVMEADGDPSRGYYQAYTANEAGLRSALLDIYNRNEAAADYIMYIGSDITALPSDIFNDLNTAADTGDVTFASLKGRLNNLVITGNKDDAITDTPTAAKPDTNKHISVKHDGARYFGCHMILRNIRHTFSAGNQYEWGVYMNGYNLTLGGGSWQMEETRYFGGSSTGTVTLTDSSDRTAVITVYSTGNEPSYFIGGMYTGTLDGNAAITIHGTSGNMINIYGGGWGTKQTPAIITGSVTNTISGMAANKGGLRNFVGGVDYGTVSGKITNTISGEGRFYSSDDGMLWSKSYFVGGSRYGDIGSKIEKNKYTYELTGLELSDDYIIKNVIDTSNYTYGQAAYNGTNYGSGIVKGNVINLVRAGTSKKGSLTAFSGGSGYEAIGSGSWEKKFTVDTKGTVKVSNIEAGLDAAKEAAGYQLYGNIKNVIYAGCICSFGYHNHWFRGAGWGYMEGHAYSEVGTDGVVYLGNYNSYSYSSNNRNQGEKSWFDLVGGGGSIADNDSFCIKGDTTLVTRNVVARWTYGGSFGGVQIGNSLRSHHGGVVDTCEGTGYRSYIHVGNGRAEVHDGQVDWFVSGGGWHDRYQEGDVSVEVFDGPNLIINGSLGGTYGGGLDGGSLDPHYISGDSTIVVHGGDFSGKARIDQFEGFSAGPTNKGTIYGNAAVTIDLRGNQNGFFIEDDDSISGGRRLKSTGSYLGTDSNNTITLNILADEKPTDLLSRLNIYGDAGSSANYTRAGHIIINVNAPGAAIGNIYATCYSNISKNVLRKNVQVNLVSANTITGLRAGNSKDKINNAVARESAAVGRAAVINVGPQSETRSDLLGEWETGETADGLPHRINITGNGIAGFTEMDIKKRLLAAQSGAILNGLSATINNHAASYHQFGKLTLHAGDGMGGSGLGISDSPAARFIAGSASVEGAGKVYIQSSGVAGQIVLTDITTNADSTLMWRKTGNISANTSLNTNKLKAGTGWRVITFNPDKTAANNITPANFTGFEETTGKFFTGDSDTHFSGINGYGVAIPSDIDVTISKQVKGGLGDRTKEFTFRIFLQDTSGTALASGTQLTYQGGMTAGSGTERPGDGTLTLDSEGSATFVLKHGQNITISEVPPGKIRIIETADSNYTTSFLDSGTGSSIDKSDTGMIIVATGNRTFDFINTRKEAVPAGVMIGNNHEMVLLILSMLLLMAVICAAHIHYRRKRS